MITSVSSFKSWEFPPRLLIPAILAFFQPEVKGTISPLVGGRHVQRLEVAVKIYVMIVNLGFHTVQDLQLVAA